MALFGTDMTQVVTPDGRTITVPQQLAAQFPGLTTAAAPVPSAMPPQEIAPPIAPQGPPDPTATAPLPPDSALVSPVTTPSQSAPSGPQVPRGPATTPAQANDAGPPNSPAPVTNDSLAKSGNAGAYNATIAATEEARTANHAQGEALANQATQVGNAMVTADQHAADLLAERKRVADDNAAALQAKQNEYLRNAKSIADTKIDRKASHPVLAAISVMLGAVGGAMLQKQNGGAFTNPALDAFYKAIDRKVDGQMKDLDLKRQGLATDRDALNMQRQAGMDQLTEMDTHRIGYLEQARRQIETIAQQSKSDIVRSNAQIADAAIREKQADTLGAMVGREQTRRDQEQARKQTLQIAQMSNATAIRGQDMQQRESDLNRTERSQEKLDTISAQIALAKDKDAEKRAKEVKEQGVIDPRTGDPLLTPAGADKMIQADREEAQARTATDPAQAQRINEHAALLRQSAQTNDIAVARDAKDREKVQGALDSTHNLALLADKTISKLEQGPGAFDRQAWAGLKADLAVVKARYVATLGERVSVRALEAFDDVLSIDADGMVSRFADQGKALQALKTLRSDAAQNADVTLKGAAIKSKWKPGLSNTDQVSFGGSTAQEIAADAKPAPVVRAVKHLLYPFGSGADEEIQAPQDAALESANARTNAKGQWNSYGLDPGDNDKLSALVERSRSVSHAEYDRIADTLKDPLTQERPGLAVGVARKIRDSDPKLFAAVMAKLSATDPEKAKAISDAITPRAAPEKRSLSDLSDEERQQLIDQRSRDATLEERDQYRKAYDARAVKGAR